MSVDLKAEQQKYRDKIESNKKVLEVNVKNGVRKNYRPQPAKYMNRNARREARVEMLKDFRKLHPLPPKVKVFDPEGAKTRTQRRDERRANANH